MISYVILKVYVSLIVFGLFMAEHLESWQNPEYNEPCMIEGKLYQPGDRILRNHVCHVCMCRFGRAECFWSNCPPPPIDCEVFFVPDICNPSLYVCPIPEDLVEPRYAEGILTRNEFQVASDGNFNSTSGDCQVLGVPYKTGDVMGVATNFCLECRCARQSLFCSPKCCFSYARYSDTNQDLLEREQKHGPKQRQPHPLYHLYDSE